MHGSRCAAYKCIRTSADEQHLNTDPENSEMGKTAIADSRASSMAIMSGSGRDRALEASRISEGHCCPDDRNCRESLPQCRVQSPLVGPHVCQTVYADFYTLSVQ